tara:strand:- start:37 stop:1110 length:1074 start_codon:yes stop_codon:yes gene_type:complete
MPLSDDHFASDEILIDFSSAGLYLCGLQTVCAVIACAATSVACCWLLPPSAVSAVRTLAVTSAVGFCCMRKPIRVGRVRGVTVIFNALRPCVALYILSLTLEQLVHTCVADHAIGGSWRHVIFHMMMFLIICSAFSRAHKPKNETDVPFLITSASLLVVAMLPPPATPLSGPLCQAASMFSAAERMLRAMLFGAIYVIHVYAAAPSHNSIHEISVCTMRSGAAAVWILGVYMFALVLAPVQAALALWVRFGTESSLPPPYAQVDTRSDSGGSDAEMGGMGSSAYYDATKESTPLVGSLTNETYLAEGVPVDPRSIAQPGMLRGGAGGSVFSLQQLGGPAGGGAMSQERMAQIAAGLA